MDELFSCISLTFMDSLVSVFLIILNVIYVVWGWFAPNSDDRENLEKYINSLKNYQNFVTYSDSLLLLSKLVLVIIIRYLCCAGKAVSYNQSKEVNVKEI